MSAVERSDLPVGQQSKGSVPVAAVAKGKIVTESDLDALLARVRAQVAEEIACELEAIAGSEQAPMAYQYRHAMRTAARIARKHAGKAFPSSPAALPDVVGTRRPVEAIPVRAVPQTWSSRMGNACFAVDLPPLREGDRIAVSFDANNNVWHGRVLGVRRGVGGSMWIDAAPVGALPEDEGTRQEGLINVEDR